MYINLEYEILELALDEFDLMTAFAVADERLHITRQEIFDAIKTLERKGLLEIYNSDNDKSKQATRIEINHLSQKEIEDSYPNLFLCQSEKTRQRLAEIFTEQDLKQERPSKT